MPFIESTFTLTKRASTRDGELHLTTDIQLGETGVKVKKPVFQVCSLAKAGEGSRLDNWRALLVAGREVKIIEDHTDDGPIPVVAQLRLTEDDECKWDSEPVEKREWVVFWVHPPEVA